MYFHSSLMKKGAGMGLIFVSPLGVNMRYMVRLQFAASNNMVEYEALINGLHIAVELGIRWLDIHSDPQLVVGQVMKELSCHDPTKKCANWRTSSTASNSVTSPNGLMRQPTSWQRWRPAVIQSRLESLLAINTNL
jgi:ribonuclease HI